MTDASNRLKSSRDRLNRLKKERVDIKETLEAFHKESDWITEKKDFDIKIALKIIDEEELNLLKCERDILIELKKQVSDLKILGKSSGGIDIKSINTGIDYFNTLIKPTEGPAIPARKI